MDDIQARRLLGNLIGAGGNIGVSGLRAFAPDSGMRAFARGAGVSSASTPAFAKIDESALRKLKSVSGAGGLAGLVGGTQGAAGKLGKVENSIFSKSAPGSIVGGPDPIGAFDSIAAFDGGAAGAQRGGGNKNKPKTKGGPKGNICPDDRVRLKDYAPPSQIGAIVDGAIEVTTISEFLIGFSGTRVDRNRRYVYSDQGWIDLQHVVSAVFSALSAFGLSEIGGIAFEILQFPFAPQSSFRGEDIRSNRIGQRAALIYMRSGQRLSFGQSVIRAMAGHTLHRQSKAKRLLTTLKPC